MSRRFLTAAAERLAESLPPAGRDAMMADGDALDARYLGEHPMVVAADMASDGSRAPLSGGRRVAEHTVVCASWST